MLRRAAHPPPRCPAVTTMMMMRHVVRLGQHNLRAYEHVYKQHNNPQYNYHDHYHYYHHYQYKHHYKHHYKHQHYFHCYNIIRRHYYQQHPYSWNLPHGSPGRRTLASRKTIQQHIARHHPGIAAAASRTFALDGLSPSHVDRMMDRLAREGISPTQLRKALHLLRWSDDDVNQAMEMLKHFKVSRDARICALVHGNILATHPQTVFSVLQYLQQLAQLYYSGEANMDQVGLFISSILKRNASIISTTREKAENLVNLITGLVDQELTPRNELPRRILSTFLIQYSSLSQLKWAVRVFQQSGLVSDYDKNMIILHCLESLVRPRLFASLPYRAQWLAARLGIPTTNMIKLLPTRPEIFLLTQMLLETKIRVLTSLHTLIPEDWNDNLKQEMENMLRITPQELSKHTTLFKFNTTRHIERAKYFISRKIVPPTHFKIILKWPAWKWNKKFRN